MSRAIAPSDCYDQSCPSQANVRRLFAVPPLHAELRRRSLVGGGQEVLPATLIGNDSGPCSDFPILLTAATRKRYIPGAMSLMTVSRTFAANSSTSSQLPNSSCVAYSTYAVILLPLLAARGHATLTAPLTAADTVGAAETVGAEAHKMLALAELHSPTPDALYGATRASTRKATRRPQIGTMHWSLPRTSTSRMRSPSLSGPVLFDSSWSLASVSCSDESLKSGRDDRSSCTLNPEIGSERPCAWSWPR
mmetsp:Transcript_7824/g.19921  ORF Transcript_7824/g.19921 Transcript_7824/m.19921 type:complete len:250 (-) Transcript_7824:835-1584(-)